MASWIIASLYEGLSHPTLAADDTYLGLARTIHIHGIDTYSIYGRNFTKYTVI